MSTPENPPAFPTKEGMALEQPDTPGMTLRDYHIVHILQGFCANPSVFGANPMNGWALVNATETELVKYAGDIADMALAERAK